MKIAFTTKGTNWDSQMDSRFGRTDFILIYDDNSDELTSYSNKDSVNEAHGVGPKTAQKLFELQAKVLITGTGPGGNAGTVLEKVGTTVFIGAGEMTVKEAYEAYKNNELKKA